MDPELLARAEQVLAANRAAGRCIVTAESCTGGLVAAALTEIAGASDVFERGFVTYSNDAKLESIGVNQDILQTFGAVSIAVAWAMAQGALEHSKADVAVAITGIAGPGGGSDKKPVGTVVFARAERDGNPDKVTADVRHFGDLGRSEIRRQAALVALDLLMPGAEAP
ncbi:CinA family protein [Polymorphobacter sp.]|uniref:CinA family protein n=1 Tax=Polymorphobacter sp. TaxID=1909290 RepID=UPI003F6F62B4